MKITINKLLGAIALVTAISLSSIQPTYADDECDDYYQGWRYCGSPQENIGDQQVLLNGSPLPGDTICRNGYVMKDEYESDTGTTDYCYYNPNNGGCSSSWYFSGIPDYAMQCQTVAESFAAVEADLAAARANLTNLDNSTTNCDLNYLDDGKTEMLEDIEAQQATLDKYRTQLSTCNTDGSGGATQDACSIFAEEYKTQLSQFQGTIDGIDNQVDDLREAFSGGAVADITDNMNNQLNNLTGDITGVQNNLQNAANNIATAPDTIANNFNNKITDAQNQLRGVLDDISDIQNIPARTLASIEHLINAVLQAQILQLEEFMYNPQSVFAPNFDAAFEGALDRFERAIETIQNLIQQSANQAVNTLQNAPGRVTNAFSTAGDAVTGIGDDVTGIIDDTQNTLTNAPGQITGAIGDTTNGIISGTQNTINTTYDAFGNTVDSITGLPTDGVNAINNTITGTQGNITASYQEMQDSISAIPDNIVNSVFDNTNSMLETTNNLPSNVMNNFESTVTDTVNNVSGGIINNATSSLNSLEAAADGTLSLPDNLTNMVDGTFTTTTGNANDLPNNLTDLAGNYVNVTDGSGTSAQGSLDSFTDNAQQTIEGITFTPIDPIGSLGDSIQNAGNTIGNDATNLANDYVNSNTQGVQDLQNLSVDDLRSSISDQGTAAIADLSTLQDRMQDQLTSTTDNARDAIDGIDDAMQANLNNVDFCNK